MKNVFVVTVYYTSSCVSITAKQLERLEVYESRTDAVAAMRAYFEQAKKEWLTNHSYYTEADFNEWSNYSASSAHIDYKLYFEIVAAPLHKRNKTDKKKK